MNKFTKQISNNGNKTLKRRAANLAQTAEIAQQNLINSLKQQKAELELKLDTLTDLAPESTDSLRPGSTNWDPVEWTKSIQETKQTIYFIKIQIELAENTYNEYFTEED